MIGMENLHACTQIESVLRDVVPAGGTDGDVIGNGLRPIVYRIDRSKYHDVIPREVSGLSLNADIESILTVVVQVKSCKGSSQIPLTFLKLC